MSSDETDYSSLPFGERPALSSSYFKYWVLDHEAGEVKILLQDGRSASTKMDESLAAVSEVSQTFFDWERWWVISRTKRGHGIFSEVYSPESPPPFNGRKSVYLDQNHWSTIALAVMDPQRISEHERVAALRIRELALDGGIVCALSSATMVETARMDRERRYQVGVMIASMAGGWQLRHPLAVRRAEFAALFARELGLPIPAEAQLPVVSLEPYSIFDEGFRAWDMDPKGQELFLAALSGPSVVVDLLLDPERIDAQVPSSWVEANQNLAKTLNEVPKEERRAQAHVFAWQDNSNSILQALELLGTAAESIAHLTARDLPRLLSSMPMVGLFSELMVRRHMEPNRRWKGNDLTDMMYLSAGAAYCDYVVAERATGRQLGQVQRSLGRAQNVHVTLESLVAQLDRDGVKTFTERTE